MLSSSTSVVSRAAVFLYAIVMLLHASAFISRQRKLFRNPTTRNVASIGVDDSLMAFGRRMQVDVRLPTRDREMAALFLKAPEFIIETAFDRRMVSQLSSEKYLIKFMPIPIPGVDVVTPEIEMTFVQKEDRIEMASQNWTLRGMTGNILKDSRFMESFDISIQGELYLNDPLPNGVISTSGWVEYQVQGRKPTVFQRAPAFMLDGTINLIQDCTADFVNKQFAGKMLQAFRNYSQTVRRIK